MKWIRTVTGLAVAMVVVGVLAHRAVSHPDVLMTAAARGDLRAAKRAIALGADVNSRDHEGGTPLCDAVLYGHRDMVELLVTHGARVNLGSHRRAAGTPLLIAAAEGKTDIVEYLLDHGARVTETNSNGATALHFAAWNRHVGVVRLLIHEGADVEATTGNGNTCLHSINDYSEAYATNYLETVRALLDSGAAVNATNRYGKYPLFDAIMFGDEAAALALLQHGASTDISSGTYAKPIEVASRSRRGQTIAELIRDFATRRADASLSTHE